MKIRSPLFPAIPCLLVACGGSQVADFGPPKTVTKEQRPMVWDATKEERLSTMSTGSATTKSGGADTAGAQGRQWTGDTPAGWEQLPPQGQFRDAVWRIAGNADTECYLTASSTGPVGTNLRRWYTDQFGVGTVPAPEGLPVVDLAGKPGRLVEITGTFKPRGGVEKPGWATLIAYVAADGAVASSFKFTGPEAIVVGNKDKFLALAKSLRSASASPNPQAPPIDRGAKLPEGHMPIGQTDPHGAPPPAAKAPFTAKVPAGWTAKPNTSRWLHHGFGSDGEVYVGQLGGGLKPTLDIWRGELEQQPMTDAEFQALPKAAFLGEDAVMLDLAGNFRSMSGKQLANARVLIAARGDGNSITFVKLVGPAADVAAQVDAFKQFCASVRRAE